MNTAAHTKTKKKLDKKVIQQCPGCYASIHLLSATNKPLSVAVICLLCNRVWKVSDGI